jgi:hypothetical protein
MSVHRLAKYQTDDPFTRIPNTAINSGLSLKGLGLLVFMLSKPNGWNFTERGLMAQLNVGRHALASAMDELIDAGYVRRTLQGDGNLRRWVTEVYDVPCSGFPSTELPERRETEALSNNEIEVTNERSNKAPAKTKTAMTETWEPDSDNLARLTAKHPTLRMELELEQFRDYWISKGERRADWNAGLRTWCRNAERFAKQRPEPGKVPHRKKPVGPNGYTFCQDCGGDWEGHDPLLCKMTQEMRYG